MPTLTGMRRVTTAVAVLIAIVAGGGRGAAEPRTVAVGPDFGASGAGGRSHHGPQPPPAPLRAEMPPPAGTPFRGDIDRLARQNTDFRRVLFTAGHVQIVAMSIPPNDDIGPSIDRVDQCYFIVAGEGQTMVAGKAAWAKPNDVLCVPAGQRYNVRNAGTRPLKLYTLSSPPRHPAGTVNRTKQDAVRTASGPAPAQPAPASPRSAPGPARR
jgi:mannose-6-phosphate isomerase-like protein (cupin superfamily)